MHPLRGVLENLQYPSWLLEPRTPMPPKVNVTPALRDSGQDVCAHVIEEVVGEQ